MNYRDRRRLDELWWAFKITVAIIALFDVVMLSKLAYDAWLR